MATLRYSQIRAHPDGTINYIANKEKIVSVKTHDIYNVLNYMGEPESTERVYSFSRHCSTNPTLAAKQMELYRARYCEAKQGGVQGLKEGKEELLGLHFFMSYTEEDNPTEKTMNYILSRLAAHPLLRDHAVFGANHFDKKHRHTHFYVCQYSADGKPHKLCMRHDDYHELRRYANRLCVEQGLSIIDLPVLRHNNPEYSAWIDGVIAAGKVKVHPEREEHKGAKRQKASTRQIYYKWLKDTEEFNLEQERLLTKEQLSKKRGKEFFWTVEPEDKPMKVYPVTGKKNKYYAVRRWDENGRERTVLELVLMLIKIIYENERKRRNFYIEDYENKPIIAYTDYRIQNAYDQIATARELNIERPSDIPDRIVDIGKQMNALKKEKARHENSIKKHEEILDAYKVYHRIRSDVEGVADPDPELHDMYKWAYAVLAKNNVLTFDAYYDILRRYNFEKQKVVDYDKRMPVLKRQYRSLKHLEAVACRPAGIIDSIYQSHAREHSQCEPVDIDGKIKSAEARKSPKTDKAKGDDLLEKT